MHACRWLALKVVIVAALAGTGVAAFAGPSAAAGCGGSLPGASLSGVAATSSSGAWAVGYYPNGSADQTLIERWDGSAWCQVTSPDPGGSARDNALSAVTATSSSNAWAVGYYVNSAQVEQTLVLHWNGTSWNQVASPDPGTSSRYNALSGVTATWRSNAWAVGYYVNSAHVAQTLALHWNGTAWSVTATPDRGTNNELLAVKATSKTNAWAVGYNDTTAYVAQTLAMRWNGTAWSVTGSPDPGGSAYASYLSSVAVLTSSDAFAAGYYFNATSAQTMSMHWNGNAWQQAATPSPDNEDNVLYGIAAVSTSDAWAVGAYRDSGSLYQTLIVRWDGTAWQQVPSPNPAVSDHNILNAVATTSASDAWAVGFAATASGTVAQTLILHWDGTAWTQVPSP
jgi:hypothetical protein